ncbi:alpha/beta hydrolase [Nocardia jejuensis]|uniref:alpha/beta hydrolase n=1 Tax=Nocardia jejuensis TaxID=328049 RepID=UPI000833C856|nr:alpha/beta hydrolase [Nocardia jejuensis]
MTAQNFTHRTDFPGGSLGSRLVSAMIRTLIRPIISLWARYPDVRWPYRAVDWLGRPLSSPRGLVRESVALPECTGQLTIPRAFDPERFVLYLHGGGFVVGGLHLHRQMTGRFATDLRSRVFAVNYRKLPGHAVSLAVSDCVDGYRQALAWGYSPDRITLMGDSAGGYLVLMTAVEIRRQGLPMPAAIVSMAPLTDWDFTAKLAAPTAATCDIFRATAMPSFERMARAAAAGIAPESPAHVDLTGLPPTLIQASSSEFLYPDAVLMADRLLEHGVPCRLQIWANQVHVFQAAAAIAPEAAAAVSEIRRFIDETLATPAESRSA